MRLDYITLRNEKLSLDNISDSQKELLKEIYQLYKSNPDFSKFAGKIFSKDSLERMGATVIVNGRYFIDRKLARTTIYEIIQDLEFTLGIQQGFFQKEKLDERKIKDNYISLEKFLGLKDE